MTKTLGMMLMAVAVTCLLVAALAGGTTDNGPGCGLGKLAWEDSKHPKNIGPQIMMATTNGTFGSQTFGISSGTSGCTNDGTIFADQKVNMFASINFENLSQDMAQGRGEHLASLATLMGVPAEHQAEFFAMAQEQYTTLIKSGEATPVAMLKALNAAMAGRPALAKLSANR